MAKKRKKAGEAQIRRRPGVAAAERGVAFWEGLLGLLALLEPRGAVDRHADVATFSPGDWFAISQQGFDSPGQARKLFERWVKTGPEGVLLGDGASYTFKPSSVEPGLEAALAHLKQKRRKKVQGKKEKRRAALADANRKAELWIDLEEFVRNIEFNKGQVDRRGDVGEFSAEDWVRYSSKRKPGTPEAVLRRFERWKQKFPKGTFVAFARGEDHLYRFSPAEVSAQTKGAVDRRDFFLRASGRATPYGEETERQREASISRTTPIKEVLLGLGVPYSGAKAKRWHEKLGMPVRIERRGKTQKTYYYADSGEVFDWIQDSIREGKILDPFQKKLPVSEARPRVQKAIAVLSKRAAKSQIARIIGTTPPKLDSYLRESVNLKFIPRDVVIALEDLVKEGMPEVKRHRPRPGAPTLVEIKQAIADAGGNLTHAEKALRAAGFTKGITGSNLSQIAKRYKIPVRTRRVVEPSKKEIKDALKEHGYSLSATADSFGFSVQPLHRLIDKYELRGLIEKYGRGKITVHDLIDASNASEFSTVAAAELLNIDRSHFRSLMDYHGILPWFDEEHEKRVAALLKRERKNLYEALWKASRAGKTREQFADSYRPRGIRKGKMARTHLESRIKILGLQKQYSKLKRQKRFAGERLREIAPTETRVPFWLSALRELRARYPGRGGGRKLAAALGYGNATISNWLSGNRVPGMPQIKKIMGEAEIPMPDWMGRLEELIQEHGSKAAASRALGVLSIANIMAGRTFPSEKLLERILGEDFWVVARVQPDTGARPGVSMGEVPTDVAQTQLSQAMARLMTTVRSQRELAGLLEVSPASISRFMRAKIAAPPPRVRDKIVELYQERFGEAPPGVATQHTAREALDRALGLFPTQTALAEELGMTRGHLARVVSGHNTISPRIHQRLEALLKDLEGGVQKNPPRRFDVRSPAQGLRAIQHPAITQNYEKALRVKPKHKKAVLVPCAGTKPFPDSPSHKHGYLPALEGKKVDVYVVSEPLGVVPYSWSRRYPQESYDFPPHHLRGRAHDVLAGRVTSWLKRVGPKYSKITLALPAHHMRLVDKALDMLGYEPTKIVYAGIGDCLDAGACPPGSVRPTTHSYRKFLKARANPPAQPSCPDCEVKIGGLWRTGVCDECKHLMRAGKPADPRCYCHGTGRPVCCRCEGSGADPFSDNPPEGLGDCFEVSLNYITNQAIQTGGKTGNLRLIHATVTGQGPIAGVPHSHAWVEELVPPDLPPGTVLPPWIDPDEYGTWWAIDRSSGRDVRVPAVLYHLAGHARNVKRYTYDQARREVSKHKHYGPWHPGGPGRNPPPRTGGPAFFGRDRVPVEVIRPAWSGDKGYWDVVFLDDGEEATVSEIDLYTTDGDRWRVPVRKPGRQAWTNNPFGLTPGQIGAKVIGWTATGAVADVLTSRINKWITQPVTEAAEGAIIRGAGAVVKNPSWQPPACDPSKRPLKLKGLKGKFVRTHVNLHNGCFVVSYKSKVQGYSKALRLKDVRPRVGRAGWERCNTSKVRNVHAYLDGELVSGKAAKKTGSGWRQISYHCKTHGPHFFFVDTDKPFLGAREALCRKVKKGGQEKVEVWVRGPEPARKNPADCECGAPEGVCSCGEVDTWIAGDPEKITPCGQAPRQVGVHTVERPWGSAILLLDVGNVKAYGSRDWHERGRCPLLGGFSAPGARIARDMLNEELAHYEHAAVGGRPQKNKDLARLAARVGIPLAQAEDMLVDEGHAWHHAMHSDGAAHNP